MRLFATALILWIQGYLFAPELIKLPALWAHYLEHRAHDPALDLEGFLSLHYSDLGHQEDGHHDHEDLPYHHHHGSALDQCGTKLISGEHPAPVSFPMEQGHRMAIPLPGADLSAGFRSALLQPPRPLA
jgi:hypothetical protein